MDLGDIDLLDRDRFTRGIPHDWFTYLRANAPIYRHPEPDGPGFWVISKHADIVTCNRDAASFSSQAARGGVVSSICASSPADRPKAGPPRSRKCLRSARVLRSYVRKKRSNSTGLTVCEAGIKPPSGISGASAGPGSNST